MTENVEEAEPGAIQAVALVRAAIVAHAIEAALRSGLLGTRHEHGNVRAACQVARVDPVVAQAIVDFLVVEGLLKEEPGRLYLSTSGRGCLSNGGLFRLLVGGYGPLWRGLAGLLVGTEPTGGRDLTLVAEGSGMLAASDALPLSRRLWPRGRSPQRLLDVGFGDGSMLIALASEFGLTSSLGIEPADELVDLARSRFKMEEGEVCFRLADGLDVTALAFATAVIICAFVLQEMAAQTGRLPLIKALAAMARRWPDADLIVIEVMRPLSTEMASTSFGRDYYAPYALVHALTRQELLSHEEWMGVFDDAGYRLEQELIHRSPTDHTGLSRGFRLRAR